MNNLFDFATKELTQDAFISWLLSNYKDKEIGSITISFLNFLTNNYFKNKDIQEIIIHRQYNKIDILVDIFLKINNEKVSLIIEDKVDSGEHSNQLWRYKNWIENNNYYSSFNKNFFIFYKTSYIWLEDKKIIEKDKWDCFDVFQISKFWNLYKNSENSLIKMYANYVLAKANNLSNKTLPKENNVYAWEGFFRNYLEASISKKELLTCWSFITRYSYSCFGCRPKEEMDGFPYLEIRNRDCLNNNIKILICRYHRDSNIDDIKDYQELKRRVIEVENQYDENNKIFKVIGTEKQNKTFAMYICEKVDDEKTFLNIVEKAIDRYLEIIKDFKHTIKEDYVQDSFHN